MSQSRYIREYHRPFPHTRKAKTLYAYDHEGKLVKCRFCGFICNTDRDRTGDGVGYHVTDVVDPGIYRLDTGDVNDITLSIDNDSTIHMSALSADGTPLTVSHNFTTTVSSGCPQCGSLNYR